MKMVEMISVFGIYVTRADAEETVAALRVAGFRNTDISALLPEKGSARKVPSEKNLRVSRKNARPPRGAMTGAASGVAVGGVLGWLAGIGVLTIPGADALGDTFIGAGPVMGMIAGAGAAGVVGGFVGALAGLGISENDAKHYEERIKAGAILLSVRCDNADWMGRAEAVLKRTGAEHISSSIRGTIPFP